MDYFSSILLGLVQGLTEFLPVSSSGHLVLFQHFLGLRGPQVEFDLLLHGGTLLAVVIYFRQEIFRMAGSLSGRPEGASERRWIMMIILASIPTAIIGFAFREQFETLFGDPHRVSIMLLVTAALLFLSDRIRVTAKESGRVGAVQGIIIGVVQGIAIIPGISRSGSTISAGILSGVDRITAARFSFLISIPAILGAMILEVDKLAAIQRADLPPYFLGTITAFAVGYLSIGWLMRVISRRRLWHFAIYLLIIGCIGFILT